MPNLYLDLGSNPGTHTNFLIKFGGQRRTELNSISATNLYSAIDLMEADANQSGVALVEPDNRSPGLIPVTPY